MKKDLFYYMKLNYPIEIVKIPVDEGGGYSASIPQLGKYACISDGVTIDEALKNLEEVKREWFQTYIERGTIIPEPQVEEDEEYSGRFVMRIPKELHRSLSVRAKQSDLSLNQYVQYLLTASWVTDGYDTAMENCVLKFNQIIEEMRTIEYKIVGASEYQPRQEPLKVYKLGYGEAA